MNEKNQHEISPGRKFLFLLIMLFVFLLLIEGLLSMYFYQQDGGERTASLETFRTIKKKISGNGNSFVYEPWVEYRHKITSGPEIQNEGLTRSSAPDFYLSKIPGDTLNIYFFGGETMFGENLTDSATIPSQFVKLYMEKFPQGNSVRVHNYGSSHYYSYQELVLLSDLIQKGHRPDILVYLDGINDFRFGVSSYYRQSYFSYIFRQFFDSGLRSTGKFVFFDTAHALSKTPAFIPDGEFSNSLVGKYVSNIQNISMLADMIDIEAYFFCEPSPYYTTPAKSTDDKYAQDVFSRFRYIYPRLQKMQDSLRHFTFLGDVAEQKDFEFPGGTYSPSLSRKIAEKILTRLLEDSALAKESR